MTFDEAIDTLWSEYPGWRWLVKCNDDCTAFWARIESPDFDAVTWTAGDMTKTDIMRGTQATSGWADTPAEAILHAVLMMEANQ